MTGDGLFDVPDSAHIVPPPAGKPGRGERRRRLVALRIATGVHPLGKGLPLHPDAPRARGAAGPTCGGCRYRVITTGNQRTYPKCWFPTVIGDQTRYLRDTGCEASDIRRWWPACRDYQRNNESEPPE